MSKKFFNYENLRKIMEELYMAPDTLAAQAGVSVTTVRNWLRGNTTPSTENVKKLEEVFSLSAGWFEKEEDITGQDAHMIASAIRKMSRPKYEEQIKAGTAGLEGMVYPYLLYRAVFGTNYKPEILTSDQEDGLHQALRMLNDREREVLYCRFVLRMTLEEAGKKHNVRRERIRQIEAKALRKMRHPLRSWLLRDGLQEGGRKLLPEEARCHFGKEAGEAFVFRAQEYTTPCLQVITLHPVTDEQNQAEDRYYYDNGTWVYKRSQEKVGCLPMLEVAGGSGQYVLDLTESQYEDFQKLPSTAIITVMGDRAVCKMDIDRIELYPAK